MLTKSKLRKIIREELESEVVPHAELRDVLFKVAQELGENKPATLIQLKIGNSELEFVYSPQGVVNYKGPTPEQKAYAYGGKEI